MMIRCATHENSCTRACVNGGPCGVINTTRDPARRNFSTASKIGSGFINMPGPPPYGLSSTTRCLSWVKSRKLWTRTLTSPFCCARFRMLSSSGPSKMRGNNVKTSISIPAPRRRSPLFGRGIRGRLGRRGTFGASPFGLNNLKHRALALLGRRARQERANCRDRAPALADNLAHVGLVQPQFEDHDAFPFHLLHVNFIGVIDQCFHYEFDKRFHVVLPSLRPAR